MTDPTRPAAEALTAESVARLFHEAYERLAPDYGYRTREATAVPWPVPEPNRSLMVAVADEVLAAVRADATSSADAEVAALRAERDDWRRQWEDDVARVSGEREALRAEVAVWKGHHRREVEAKRKTAEHNRRLAAEKKAAEAEVARLREALTEAQEVMHDEYCTDRRGVMSHRPVCEAALAALAARPAAGASQPLPAAEVAPTPAAPEAEPERTAALVAAARRLDDFVQHRLIFYSDPDDPRQVMDVRHGLEFERLTEDLHFALAAQPAAPQPTGHRCRTGEHR